jgi:hypothetical protein
MGTKKQKEKAHHFRENGALMKPEGFKVGRGYQREVR